MRNDQKSSRGKGSLMHKILRRVLYLPMLTHNRLLWFLAQQFHTSIPVTVSLTTISSRAYRISKTIDSLCRQFYKPQEIILWVSKESHMIDEGIEEKTVNHLRWRYRKHNVKIQYTPNIGSYRKLLPLLNKNSGTIPETLTVTVDDDVEYPAWWLRNLWKAHLKHPNQVICFTGDQVKTVDQYNFAKSSDWTSTAGYAENAPDIIGTGCLGILYPKNTFTANVLDPAFREICSTHDDLWFWFNARLAGKTYTCLGWQNGPFIPHFVSQDRVLSHKVSLFKIFNEGRSSELLRGLCTHFGVEPGSISSPPKVMGKHFDKK